MTRLWLNIISLVVWATCMILLVWRPSGSWWGQPFALTVLIVIKGCEWLMQELNKYDARVDAELKAEIVKFRAEWKS